MSFQGKSSDLNLTISPSDQESPITFQQQNETYFLQRDKNPFSSQSLHIDEDYQDSSNLLDDNFQNSGDLQKDKDPLRSQNLQIDADHQNSSGLLDESLQNGNILQVKREPQQEYHQDSYSPLNDNSLHDDSNPEEKKDIYNEESKSTRKTIKFAVNLLETYLVNIHSSFADVENLSNSGLDSLLCDFYSSTRSRNQDFYSRKTMETVRWGLQRHFLTVRNIDITKQTEFPRCNQVFKELISLLKDKGKDRQLAQPISEEDMALIRGSLNLNRPEDLQNKVFMDIMINFSSPGKETLRGMTPGHFMVHTLANGRRVITMKDPLTQGIDNKENKEVGMMKELQGNPNCPVASFLKYIQKLNPVCTHFWQRPLSTCYRMLQVEGSPWYNGSPLGKHTLGKKMRNISSRAGTSKKYNNRSLRVTSAQIVADQFYCLWR